MPAWWRSGPHRRAVSWPRCPAASETTAVSSGRPSRDRTGRDRSACLRHSAARAGRDSVARGRRSAAGTTAAACRQGCPGPACSSPAAVRRPVPVVARFPAKDAFAASVAWRCSMASAVVATASVWPWASAVGSCRETASPSAPQDERRRHRRVPSTDGPRHHRGPPMAGRTLRPRRGSRTRPPPKIRSNGPRGAWTSHARSARCSSQPLHECFESMSLSNRNRFGVGTP